MKYIKLSEIKIKDSFAETKPKEEKLSECKEYWNENHEQDRYIVVDHDNVLLDGYIQYLTLKENNVDVAEVKISNKRRKRWRRKQKNKLPVIDYRKCETTYIFGTHLKSETKERVWRVPNSWGLDWADDLNIGDTLLVKTKYGLAPIKITRIEKMKECPVSIPVKTVVKKISEN